MNWMYDVLTSLPPTVVFNVRQVDGWRIRVEQVEAPLPYFRTEMTSPRGVMSCRVGDLTRSEAIEKAVETICSLGASRWAWGPYRGLAMLWNHGQTSKENLQ